MCPQLKPSSRSAAEQARRARKRAADKEAYKAFKASKGKGKGDGGKNALMTHNAEGKPLCFQYDKNGVCKHKDCKFVHGCRKCGKPGHKSGDCRS